MIFQDPYGSLNPRMTVGNIVGEALSVHGVAPRGQAPRVVKELLDKVGLEASHVNRYPHEFSGGQRQRIGIARALALRPKFIVCDEPVSALDVSIRIGILNLMLRLKEEHGIAFLYVTHDLASARYIADDILVMYAGQIVERGPGRPGARRASAPVHRSCSPPRPILRPG